jgi:hypothetical protein
MSELQFGILSGACRNEEEFSEFQRTKEGQTITPKVESKIFSDDIKYILLKTSKGFGGTQL